MKYFLIAISILYLILGLVVYIGAYEPEFEFVASIAFLSFSICTALASKEYK